MTKNEQAPQGGETKTTKSLRTQVVVICALIAVGFTVLVAAVVWTAGADRTKARELASLNELSGYLSGAAVNQAIERGAVATMLGMSEDAEPPASLVNMVTTNRESGERQVRAAMEVVDKLIADGAAVSESTSVFADAYESWRNAHLEWQAARTRAADRAITASEWLKIATACITAEFDMRDVAFSPLDHLSEVSHANLITRASVATLAEKAGIERALIGNAIAGKKPIEGQRGKRLAALRALGTVRSGSKD